MKNLIFLCLLFPFCLQLKAQSFKLIKTDFIGGMDRGSISSLNFQSIPTSDKGIIIVNYTHDSGTGDIPPPRYVNDTMDILLIKLDSFGNKQWVKRYGGPGFEGAEALCQTPDGGYAVLGGAESNKRNGDFAFDRIDADGNYLWSSKNYGSTRQEALGHIISTPDHGFLMSGLSVGADGDIPYNYSMPLVGIQPADRILLKTDSLGNKQWLKVLGTKRDEANGNDGLATDGQNYYFAFAAPTIDHDCVDSLRLATHFTGYSPYVFKLDANGNKLWTRAVGIGDVSDAFFDFRDSSIVVVGGSYGGYELPNGKGLMDIYLFKLDRNGVFKWGRLYGDTAYDRAGAASIRPGPNGGYYVCGTSGLGFPPQGIGYTDGWLFLTDSGGNEVTRTLFGGQWHEDCYGVLPTKDGVVALGRSVSCSFSQGSGRNYNYTTTYFPPPDGCPSNLFVSHFQLWAAGGGGGQPSAGIWIYPNPAAGQVTVALPDTGKEGTLRCMDAAGRVVFQQSVKRGTDKILIRTGEWRPGIYALSWQESGNGAPSIVKLLIQ